MILLDGKATSLQIQEELKEKVNAIVASGKRPPHLAAVLVGNDGPSQTYVSAKVKACQRVGFHSTEIKLPSDITEQELLDHIEDLNSNENVDGFIVQLPLPDHINVQKVVYAVAPSKDVDGFHPVNVGRMVKGQPCFISATPFGIMKLLEVYNVETSGKHCVVVGRSDIVGTPMSILMSRNSNPGNATVTLTHSRTKDLDDVLLSADIIIVAVGKANYLRGHQVKEGAVIIDVGITRVPDSSKKSGFRLVGDVDFEEVSPKSSYITPVPGGVGPMTIAGLLLNTYHGYLGDYYPKD